MDDEDDFSYRGSGLRIMWDQGAGPLWGDGGLLPDEPAWLQGDLGLSASLAADLIAWNVAVSALHFGEPDPQWQETTNDLNRRGEDLANRLRGEVGTRFRVRFHA